MKIELSQRKNVIDISEINKVVKELSKKKGVDAIYLFGSHARGDFHELSDIDICVMGKEEINFYEYDNLEVINFSSIPLLIQFRVFREGKLLFAKDLKKLQKLKSYTLKSYFEFLPLLERYSRRILNV